MKCLLLHDDELQSKELKICYFTVSTLYSYFLMYIYQTPQTEEEWIVIADGYYDRWQFPNCIGALDGKHVRISVPAHSGTDYHNYKGFSSLVLMALVDHDYNFLYVDVGAHGRCSDAGVWRDCTFSKVIFAHYNYSKFYGRSVWIHASFFSVLICTLLLHYEFDELNHNCLILCNLYYSDYMPAHSKYPHPDVFRRTLMLKPLL